MRHPIEKETAKSCDDNGESDTSLGAQIILYDYCFVLNYCLYLSRHLSPLTLFKKLADSVGDGGRRRVSISVCVVPCGAPREDRFIVHS